MFSGRNGNTISRSASRRISLRTSALLAPLLVVLLTGSLLAGGDNAKPRAQRDADMCPDSAQIGRRAVYLLDLRKPLVTGDGSRPGALLHAVSRELRIDDELKVFALSPYAESPLVALGRLCKPYDDATLAVTAKDGRISRDCDDLPAQIPAAVRHDANRYCALRSGLQQRIDELAARPAATVVRDAHLMDAIEAAARGLRRLSQRATLYLFSDLMQHADWYSHMDLGHRGWDFAAFQRHRAASGAAAVDNRAAGEINVKAFYVPRRGVTDRARIKHVHQHFWRRYFAERGERIAFLDQPLKTGYRVLPRMALASETASEGPAGELMLVSASAGSGQ